MDFIKTMIFTLAATFAVSCGIYTNYNGDAVASGALDLDSLCRDVPVDTLDGSTFAELSWREFFTDSLLVGWIGRALDSNSDLRTARLRTEQAQASLQASRLAFLPSASLTPQGSLGTFGGSGIPETYSLGGTAEWEISAFGGLRNEKKAKEAALKASMAYEQAVRTQLIATVAESYCSLLALDRKLEITRETQRQWSESVRVMKALKRAGERNDAAVAQAEASQLETETSILSLERQIHELENSFSTLVGIVPSSIERGSLEDRLFPEELSGGIPLHLLSGRPDVRQAEWQLAQAFYAVNGARSAFYPKITLSGSAGWTNSSGLSIANPGEWLLKAAGSLVQPLFNRGQNVANLKIAKSRLQEAEVAFRQTLLDAGAEVNDALTRLQTARRTLETDRRKVAVLETAVHSTELLMEHGSTNYLEVLTARQTLLQARLAEVSDIYDGIQGSILLYHALGGGVK